MKNGLIISILIAVCIAIFTIFHIVHPVLVLTIGDIFWMIITDVFISFLLALYLGTEKVGGLNKNKVAIWTIIGSACLIIPIIAVLIKYNMNKGK